MPIAVDWIPDEPIILATCTGFLTVGDFKGMFEQVAALMQAVEGIIYRIADYREAESSFVDIMKTVQETAKGMSGSVSDPRLKSIYVGTTHWISLARTAYQNQPGGFQIPTFHSIEDALTYIHLDMAKTHDVATADSQSETL